MVKKTIIPATKKWGKELIKESSLEHKLKVCAYIRVSTILGECLYQYHYAYQKHLITNTSHLSFKKKSAHAPIS